MDNPCFRQVGIGLYNHQSLILADLTNTLPMSATSTAAFRSYERSEAGETAAAADTSQGHVHRRSKQGRIQ
jgi:hypothetical protein